MRRALRPSFSVWLATLRNAGQPVPDAVAETHLRAQLRLRQRREPVFAGLDRGRSPSAGPDTPLFTARDGAGEQVALVSRRPFAAASMAQVHWGQLTTGQAVALKILFPGIARAIDSDLALLARIKYLKLLLPRGMYLGNLIRVARRELGRETRLDEEARAMQRYGALLADSDLATTFFVPRVYTSLVTPELLVTDYVPGTTLESVGPAHRRWLCSRILALCLREVLSWRFCQSDPNWANYLLVPPRRVRAGDLGRPRVALLDFGATVAIAPAFAKHYLGVIVSSAKGDRAGIIEHSIQLGFLTPDDSTIMCRAHTDAVLALGAPFRTNHFDFARQTVSRTVSELIPTMLRHRLTPPPDVSYVLHRKLSGMFSLCSRLGTSIDARSILEHEMEQARAAQPGLDFPSL